MTILTILIPTLIERKDKFLALSNELFNQRNKLKEIHPTLGHVEIIVDNRPKYLEGGPSIGTKRQQLLDRATGRYVCFMDDDDKISPQYLETLVRLCHEDKDCVTFRTIIKNDFYWALINMKASNTVDEEVHPGQTVNRCLWHICPIRTQIAKKFKFKDISHGEDVSWLEGVRTKIVTEAHTDRILTQYNHSQKDSEADNILKAGFK